MGLMVSINPRSISCSKPSTATSDNSALFQFTTRQLRDFIDPNHLLIRIDEAFDFAELVAPLEEKYSRDSGRPAVHPEVMIRALLISSLYDITSYRRLVHATPKNIAFRWF